jgi:hypothetical protein
MGDLKRAVNRLAFAISRNDFIERIYNVLSGALGEQYKAVVGELIGETQQVHHWRMEVEDHLYVVSEVLLKDTKSRFDKHRALEVALDQIRRVDPVKRKWAITHLQGERYKYKVPKSIKPDQPPFEKAFQQFLAGVYRTAKETLD